MDLVDKLESACRGQGNTRRKNGVSLNLDHLVPGSADGIKTWRGRADLTIQPQHATAVMRDGLRSSVVVLRLIAYLQPSQRALSARQDVRSSFDHAPEATQAKCSARGTGQRKAQSTKAQDGTADQDANSSGGKC